MLKGGKVPLNTGELEIVRGAYTRACCAIKAIEAETKYLL